MQKEVLRPSIQKSRLEGDGDNIVTIVLNKHQITGQDSRLFMHWVLIVWGHFMTDTGLPSLVLPLALVNLFAHKNPVCISDLADRES